MEDFIRFTELILTPKEAESLLKSPKGCASMVSVVKIIFGEDFAYALSLRPGIKNSILYEDIHMLLFPMANLELSKYKHSYILNKNNELLIQYKAILSFWKMETPTIVSEYINTHLPSEYILDLTRLSF